MHISYQFISKSISDAKKVRVVDPMGIRDIENTIGKNEGKVKRIKKTFLLKGKASE